MQPVEAKEEALYTPSYGSPFGNTGGMDYWTLPMDITKEEAVWQVLTADMTVISTGKKSTEKTQAYLRAAPSEDAEKVGVVTCETQGVRVNIIMVELHKRLIPSYNKDYYKYYGDEWRLAHPIGNSYQYEMSPEDTFIYLFTHFAKHYRDKGVGIRQAVDLYVYQKAYPNLNMSYIENQLTLLQLERFYFNVSHMLHTWFDSAEHTEASALISNRIFSGSVFGMEQDGQVSAMLKERNSTGSLVNAKASSWIKAIFPPLFGMQQLYPILKK